MSAETYRFFIDGKEHESSRRYITGAELRRMANIAPEYRLFLEKHREENERRHHPPDREIRDTSSVDLGEPGEEKFYTLHAPTMDIS
jgi:hypothetical protein